MTPVFWPGSSSRGRLLRRRASSRATCAGPVRLGRVAFSRSSALLRGGLGRGLRRRLLRGLCVKGVDGATTDNGTRARAGFLGDRGGLLGRRGLLRGRPAWGPVRRASRRVQHRCTSCGRFLNGRFFGLGGGFLAAGFRLAAAMADVSPVPSEGRERWRSIRAPRRLTPRDQCRAQASRRTGLATAHWCADAAQQQLARRPGGASRSTRQEKAASSPRHCPRDRGVCRQLIQRSRCGPRMFIHVTRALIGSMLLRLFTARCSANWIAAARVLLEQIVCKRFASTLIVKRV